MRSTITLLFLLALGTQSEARTTATKADSRSVADVVVSKRQTSRYMINERRTVKSIMSRMTHTHGARQAQISQASPNYPNADPMPFSTRSYARYPAWNNAQNDIPASATNPSPNQPGLADESACLQYCNGWVDPDSLGRSCTGVYWVPGTTTSCWLKGTNTAGYNFLQEDPNAVSDMLGDCDFWAQDTNMPAQMKAVCQNIVGQFGS